MKAEMRAFTLKSIKRTQKTTKNYVNANRYNHVK